MPRRPAPRAYTTAELLRIPVLTVRQAAQLSGCSYTTMRRRLKSGQVLGTLLARRWCIPCAQFLPPLP